MVKLYPYKYRDFSHIAAEAALSAWDQGRFEEMHNIMLENSPRLDRDSLIQYAGRAGLDIKKFVSDLDGMRHSKTIERDKKLAMEVLDLYNTPAFFFNGRKLLGNRPFEYFDKVMKEELDALEK